MLTRLHHETVRTARRDVLRCLAMLLLRCFGCPSGCAPCSTPNGIRTRVSAVKGRHPRPLDDGGGFARGAARRSIATAGSGRGGSQPGPATRSCNPKRGASWGRHSRMWRVALRGSTSRPGGATMCPRTRSSAFRNTTAIGKRIRKVCTLRQRGMSRAWPGSSSSRPSSPRLRARLDFATSRSVSSPTATMYRRGVTSLEIGSGCRFGICDSDREPRHLFLG